MGAFEPLPRTIGAPGAARTLDATRRHRYLTALGIDAYVARDALREPDAGGPDAETGVAAPDDAPTSAGTRAAEAPTVVAAAETSSHLAAARAMLEDAPVQASPAVGARGAEAREAESREAEPRDPAPDDDNGDEAAGHAQAPMPSAAAEAAPRVPRFRLRMLTLGSVSVLVDQAQLDAAAVPAGALRRLQDLLQTAAMQLGEAHDARSVAASDFFWPQLEDASVDQRLPQAVRALRAFLTTRGDGSRWLLHVMPEPSVPSDAAGPLRALADPDESLATLPTSALPAAFVATGEADAQRAAWQVLLADLPRALAYSLP